MADSNPSLHSDNSKGVTSMSNRLRRVGLLSALALVAAVPAVAPTAAAAKTTITMSGSTSVAALLARSYLQVCKHCVNFKLLQGGSDIGVADVAAGRVTIGNSSRDPKPSDPGGAGVA